MTAKKNHMTFATSDEAVGAANATRAAAAATIAAEAFARSADAHTALAGQWRIAVHPHFPTFALSAFEDAAEGCRCGRQRCR